MGGTNPENRSHPPVTIEVALADMAGENVRQPGSRASVANSARRQLEVRDWAGDAIGAVFTIERGRLAAALLAKHPLDLADQA